MCGIFGVASNLGHRRSEVRRDAFINGLIFNMMRGWESTGVATVANSRNQNEVSYHKRALNAVDYFDTKKVQRIMSRFHDYHFVIGHCRASTRGAAEDSNSHPFMYDHITLAHNGTIDPSKLKTRAEEPVDSASIAASMAKDGELATLENLDGGFSLVWYNLNNDTLNFARNKRKPMALAFVKGENTVYYGSEWMTTAAVVNRNGEELEWPIQITKPFVWYQFRKYDLRKFQTIPFKEYERFYQPVGMGSHWGPQARQFPVTVHGTQDKEKSSNLSTTKDDANTTNQSGDSQTSTTTTSDSSVQEAQKRMEHAGAATSPSRVASAMDRLSRVRMKLNQLVMIEPKSWHPYQNQQGRRGYLAGVIPANLETSTPTLSVEMYNVTLDQWNSYREVRQVACRIINVKGSTKNLEIVVAEEKEWQDILRRFPKSESALEQSAQVRDEEEKEGPNYEEANEGERKAIEVYGPAGSKISLEKFCELCKAGCGECGAFVNPEYHRQVIWVGDSPVCHECAPKHSLKDARLH